MNRFISKLKSIIKLFMFIIKRIVFGVKNAFCRVLSVLGSLRILSKDKRRENHNNLSVYYSDKGRLPYKGHFVNPASIDLSIIIPLFNVSEYICECLESIISQTVDYSYEVILVDDGSTDDTIKKVALYQNDNRIILLTQSNQGQSVARNKALDISRGKYIMFVDGDDILLPYSVQTLMKFAYETDSDIVEGNVARFSNTISDDIIRYYLGKHHVESDDGDRRFVLTTYGYSVAKVFRRELWKTLRYPEGYIFEDMITRYISRRKANQVVFIKDVVYGYRYNNTSSSHGQNHLKKLDSIWVLPKIFKLVEQENAPRDNIFYLLALNDIGMVNYATTRPFNDDIKLSCFAEMRKQLLSIQDCRPERMPLMFRLLEQSIVENKIEAWEYIAGSINKYGMLKKWREIN